MIQICSHQQGDVIEIQNGAFKGQQAIFHNYSAKDRVIVLLELIGQQQEVLIDEKEVVAV